MSLSVPVGFMVSRVPRSVTARTTGHVILRRVNVYVNVVGMELTVILLVDQTNMVSTVIRTVLLVSTVRFDSSVITFILVFAIIFSTVVFPSLYSL